MSCRGADAKQVLSKPAGSALARARIAFVWQGAFQHELIELRVDEFGVYANFAEMAAISPWRFPLGAALLGLAATTAIAL